MPQFIEPLESRRLLAAVVRTLPFAMEFDRLRGGVVDRDGHGTGFSIVQGNTAGDEYAPDLLDIRPTAGVLNVYSRGNAAHGGNFDADNTLANGLQQTFDASKQAFTVSTTIRGPLGYLDQPIDQGGILFGPDQDNYLKLVVVADGGGRGSVQFVDEQGATTHRLGREGVKVGLGDLSKVKAITLSLGGDPQTGTFSAFYKVNDGPTLAVPGGEITYDGNASRSLFRDRARAGILVMHKNDVHNTVITFDRFSLDLGLPQGSRPSVTAVRPAPGSTAFPTDGYIAADIRLPNVGQGIDEGTLTGENVRIVRASDGFAVPANLNTSGGGDAIVVKPTAMLDPMTAYRFEVGAGLKDLDGNGFQPYTSTFTTGATATPPDPDIAFQQIVQPAAQNRIFASVQFGPDGKLYTTTLTGEIVRYDVDPASGGLSNEFVIDTIRRRNGGAERFVTSIAFDPRSTPTNVIAWVGHTEAAFADGTDFTGKISKLYGDNLSRYVDAVEQLPRSIRDHVTNQLEFGPDGGLYFVQAANTAMGAPDTVWGPRGEHLLSSAMLRLDVPKIESYLNANLKALNVNTDVRGGYNPFDPAAPLQIYASGIRNGYDILFHSNGHTYVPANGSAAGGNTPGIDAAYASDYRIDFAANGPYQNAPVPALTGVPQTEDDYLYDVVQGGYYGHPNPTRSEFVLDGGNPTAAGDPQEVPTYPVGTLPDRNYRGAAFSFGKNVSPDGVIEYKSDVFNGKLKGKILVTRLSGPDDIDVLDPSGKRGAIVGEQNGYAGLTGLVDALDLVENPNGKGDLYVVLYGDGRSGGSGFGATGAMGQVVLLRPATGGGTQRALVNREFFASPQNAVSPPQYVPVRNDGTGTLSFNRASLSITGADAANFSLTDPNVPVTLGPGQTVNIGVSFSPPANAGGRVRTATLEIRGNDAKHPLSTVDLRGIATGGLQGEGEPSLARLMGLFNFDVKVGDTNPDTAAIEFGGPSDEVPAQQFVKAGGGPVTLARIASFGPSSEPANRVGYYAPGQPDARHVLFETDAAHAQDTTEDVRGGVKFDPGAAAFSLFGEFPQFANPDGTPRTVYQEDALNDWEPQSQYRHKMRFFPLKGADGTLVPDAYIAVWEEATGSGDFQDVVAILRNVHPAAAGPQVGLTSLDGGSFGDHLSFNYIQNRNATVPNAVHDYAKVRLRNTGTSTLTLTDLTTTGPFELAGAPGLPKSLAPGQYADLTVHFTATGGRVSNGSLRIFSNDPDQPRTVVGLSGFWQSDSENNEGGVNQEPTLEEIGTLLGYSTQFAYAGQTVVDGGTNVAVGDEVLSDFWQVADQNEPVAVKQLVAFHNQGTTPAISYFAKGDNPIVDPSKATQVFAHAAADGQSLFPRLLSDTSKLAAGTFAPGGVFGLKVDSETSDHTINRIPAGRPDDAGHHFRFYPAFDERGERISDAWLVTMDYRGINYDYQDNLYLITNMAPADRPASPVGFTAYPYAGGAVLDWGTPFPVPAGQPGSFPAITGYNVYRADSPDGPFALLNRSPITDTAYRDRGAPIGRQSYYRVTSLAGTVESAPNATFSEVRIS